MNVLRTYTKRSAVLKTYTGEFFTADKLTVLALKCYSDHAATSSGRWKLYTCPGMNHGYFVSSETLEVNANPIELHFMTVSSRLAANTTACDYWLPILRKKLYDLALEFGTEVGHPFTSLQVVLGQPDERTLSYYVVDGHTFRLYSFETIKFDHHRFVASLPILASRWKTCYGMLRIKSLLHSRG